MICLINSISLTMQNKYIWTRNTKDFVSNFAVTKFLKSEL